MAYQYQKGFIFQGTTFVTDKSDIKNAKDEDFIEGSALLPWMKIKSSCQKKIWQN